MCCLKIDTETLLANCLNTCKTYSFSPDDLQQIVRLMANATDRYIFSDTGDDALHEIVTKFPDMFVYADEDRIALRSEWQHDDKKLPMAYFDFGYSAADIKQLCAAAKKHCTTQNEQCVKSMNDDYLNRQKAITEKQLSDLSSGIFLQNFDYIVYGKRLASKSENTVEFVENTIVSHNRQELEVVASGMEAMGLSVETGYFDPDDESSVDVPKQLIGFHYVVLKKKV